MAQELVRFDSAPVRLGQLQLRLARERGEAPKAADTIEGYLAKPEGNGPFAAIVYLHGCDGHAKDDRKSIAQFVTGLGYVSLAVDSFATRGIKDACTKPLPALMLARQGDALGALSYLSKLPFVDPQRIAVLGGSMGAMVALQLASTHNVETFDAPRDLKFKAAVAYYPLCGVASEELIVPTLILIGELDDWTPARDCELWMKRRVDRVHPLSWSSIPAPITPLVSRLSPTAGKCTGTGSSTMRKRPGRQSRRCRVSSLLNFPVE